jgi:hypothetical protein
MQSLTSNLTCQPASLHRLPYGESAIREAWRLSALAEYQRESITESICNLDSLMSDIHVYTPSEKSSGSASIIVAGQLLPPPSKRFDPFYIQQWVQIKCDMVLKISFPRLSMSARAPPSLLPALPEFIAEQKVYEFLSLLVQNLVTPHLVMGFGSWQCTFDKMGLQQYPAFVSQVVAIYAAAGVQPLDSDPVSISMVERGRGNSLGRLIAHNMVDDRILLTIVFQVL